MRSARVGWWCWSGRRRRARPAPPLRRWRGHGFWSEALLAAPAPQSLGQLAGHPALGSSDPLVIWLDDLLRFLPPTGEMFAGHHLPRARPAGTDRPARHPPHRSAANCCEVLEGELTREVRMVLDNASSIELGSTRDDPDEQARAAASIPADRFPAGRPGGDTGRRTRTAAPIPRRGNRRSPRCTSWFRRASTGHAADSRGPSRNRTCSPSPATPSRRTAPTSTCATTRWIEALRPGPQANRGRRPGRPAKHSPAARPVPRIRRVRLPGRRRRRSGRRVAPGQ